MTGCQTQNPNIPSGASSSPSSVSKHKSEEEGHHHHEAPHGGALVVLGEELAHLEFVLEPESGSLTAYVLDGEAEHAVRLPGGSLELTLGDKGNLEMQPIADELTGETTNDTSTFRGQSDSLKGVDSFQATLTMVELKGQKFEKVTFKFPEGNDEEHENKHDGEHNESHDNH